MPFKGELKQAVAYNINVDNSSSPGKAAVTITKINKRDKVAAAETYTVDAGARTPITDTIGPRIDRVIIAIHPTSNQTIVVDVSQSGSFTETCAGDTDLVFDAIP